MKLGVNIDHIATLRQARIPAGVYPEPESVYPDPVMAAEICEKAGAHSVVMHLREDRRHIQDEDLFRIKKAVSIRLNLEMSIASSVVKVARSLKPHQATLVPEKRLERTTEGGLDLFRKTKELSICIEALKKEAIDVSLFVDPDLWQIEKAEKLGADAVEFHTGDYANQKSAASAEKELKRLKKAVLCAAEMGITAHAGHGLDYQNVVPVTKIKGLTELNIGYAIVSRALWVGFENAVREMWELVS